MPQQTRSIARNVKKLSTAFENLARTFDRLVPLLQAAPSPATNGAQPAKTKSGRKRPTLSTAQRKALKLQGAYMGTMRGLKPRQQAQVKKIRAAKGVRAAIEAARRLAG